MKNTELKNWDIKAFIIITLGFILLLSPMLFWWEKQKQETDLAEARTKAEWSVKMEHSIITARMDSLASDISYLHDIYEKGLENPAEYDRIAKEWIIFSNSRHVYDQIRFIAANGDEKIRVDLKTGGAVQVAAQELQNKSDRYYFSESVKFPDGSLYVSPMDLNIEHEEIELPYKPMIRLGMPLYRTNGELLGVIVLNYLADDFLNAFKTYEKTADEKLFLLNSSGYYLSNMDSKLEWGFMFKDGKKKRFDVAFPDEWAKIKVGELRQLTANGLYTSMQVQLSSLLLNGSRSAIKAQSVYCKDTWYIVALVPATAANSFLQVNNNRFMVGYLVRQPSFVILVLVAIILAAIGSGIVKRYMEIHYRAEYDPLTQAYSREGGLGKLRNLIAAAASIDMNYAICFADINGLKEINDTLGHDMGDELIVTSINTVVAQIRQHDFVIRLGGDEFLIVFSYADNRQAEKVWQRVKTVLDKINKDNTRPYIVSLSHGLVDSQEKPGLSLDEMIKLADERMYAEKQEIKRNFSSIKTNRPEAEKK